MHARLASIVLLAGLAFGGTDAFAANCGAQGQRPCTVTERLPSCDLDLTEAQGTCVRPDCGREGQRGCGPTERVIFDVVLRVPVPQVCDANLKHDLFANRCVRPACGRDNERACTVLERIPSCDVDLTERAGRCVRPLCGRENERPCRVPLERVATTFTGGLCDVNLALNVRQGLCVRPAGLADASSAAAAAGPAGGGQSGPSPAPVAPAAAPPSDVVWQGPMKSGARVPAKDALVVQAQDPSAAVGSAFPGAPVGVAAAAPARPLVAPGGSAPPLPSFGDGAYEAGYRAGYAAGVAAAGAGAPPEAPVPQTLQPTEVNGVVLEAPASVRIGDWISVDWTGPGRNQDYIVLARPGTPPGLRDVMSYRNASNSPAALNPVRAPGVYEIWYLDDQRKRILHRVGITVVR